MADCTWTEQHDRGPGKHMTRNEDGRGNARQRPKQASIYPRTFGLPVQGLH